MHYWMPKPDAALRMRLATQIIDPRDAVDDDEERGSMIDGRAVGGRPRSASKKHAFNRRRVYGPKSYFDSLHGA